MDMEHMSKKLQVIIFPRESEKLVEERKTIGKWEFATIGGVLGGQKSWKSSKEDCTHTSLPRGFSHLWENAKIGISLWGRETIPA